MMQTTLAKKVTSTVTLKVETIFESIIGGYKTVQMIVPTSSFLNKTIPNKANSRDFTGKKNPSVAPMVHTLKTEPEMFRFKNNGIRLVATDLTRNNDEVTIYFGSDEGIFNGGHTFRVCKTYGVDKAFVIVTVDLNLPKEQLANISLALNMSKKLELTSQSEKIGAFDWVKKAMHDDDIIYYEGDTGTIPVEEVLKVANIFKIDRGHKYITGNVMKAIKGKAQILKENKEGQVLNYTSYILPDMWNLYNKIITNKVIIATLPKMYSTKGKLVPSMALIFLSGVQYMTEVNKNNIPVWRKGYDLQRAYEVVVKLSKEVAKVVNKEPFKSRDKAELVYRDISFHAIVKNIFADELV